MKVKNWCFKKINKSDKLLAKMTRKTPEETQITN